ncbi:hypothetical protein DRE_06409 [Drechslerella stenobrocha 248]|uniref:Extracellular membrane protein CFEM domain-containing protein n=1 Tax=Drechslerella stenobrocha 248 TaxID=1043628 RepID=W7HLA2_9PEZI|nr:hypothetical protein DRE_06409 [Drechslerella stenobrocha 248]
MQLTASMLFKLIPVLALVATAASTTTTSAAIDSSTSTCSAPCSGVNALPSSTGTSWTETVTRGDTVVVVIVHPHPGTHSHGRAGTTTATTTTTITLSTLDAPHTSDGSSVITSFEVVANSSLSSSRLRSISPGESISSLEAPIVLVTSTEASTVDSSQVQVCTGGTYLDCIASYDCSQQPSAAMRCYCWNNVRQGCNRACGGVEEVVPEECPMLPVSQRPEGLPDAGEGPVTQLWVWRGRRGVEGLVPRAWPENWLDLLRLGAF